MKRYLVFLFSVLFIHASYSQQRTYSAYYYQRTSLFETLPASNDDIIFLGNSITDGAEWFELFQDKRIKNRGISGDVTYGVYDRLSGILKGKPAKIFLLIGINDLAKGTSPDSIVHRIGLIIRKIKTDSPHTALYVQSLLPVNDHYDMFKGHTSRWRMVLEVNRKLQKLVEQENVTYIDLYSHFIDKETGKLNIAYSNDGLHLMGKGYLKWTEIIRPYLQPFKVAMIQSVPAWGDVEQNLVNCGNHIKSGEKCDLIVLPELFTTGTLMKKKDPATSISQKKQVAAYYTKIVETMKQWASQSQAVVMGSTVYMENEKFYNRLIAAFPDGNIRFYDKHNCFKKGGYTPGEKQLVVEYKGRKIATYICYDLRFPEWSRNNSRYDVAVYVANWPLSRHEDWEKLLCERALENKATIIGVNCTGEDPHGLQYAGESMVVNPQGEIIKKGDKFSEQVIYAELE